VTADVSQIEQLLARYCHRLDRGTAREVAELFAEDGAMIPAYESSDAVRGRETISAWYERYISESRSAMSNLKHMPMAIQVDLDNDTASAVAYFTAMFVKDGRFIQAFGTYTDKLVRRGGAWLFAEHRIDTDLVLPGQPVSPA
jgi:uncharacterized protein (TIGR02246 family)